MVKVVLVVSYLIGATAIIHALTRQPTAWVKADRNKTYWLSMLIILTVFCLGIVVGPIYWISVVPRMTSNEPPSEFEKH